MAFRPPLSVSVSRNPMEPTMPRYMPRLLHVFVVVLALVVACPAAASSLPKIVDKDGRHMLLVDGKPYLMLCAQVNNSSAWPAMLPKVWPAMEALHVNTVQVPVPWAQIEPTEGHFDFSFVDTLVKQARAHRVRLVLLWFRSEERREGKV